MERDLFSLRPWGPVPAVSNCNASASLSLGTQVEEEGLGPVISGWRWPLLVEMPPWLHVQAPEGPVLPGLANTCLCTLNDDPHFYTT